MDNKLGSIYYSPKGYWKGIAAVQKLSKAAKVSDAVALEWLKRQAMWQIYLPAQSTSLGLNLMKNALTLSIKQIYCSFLPHDRLGRKSFKYALTVVDVASRYKDAEPLADKSAAVVAKALSTIYKRGPLRWPHLLIVDPEREFFGEVSRLLATHKVSVRHGQPGNHRQQGVVERFNRTLSEALFSSKYDKEMLLAERGSSERSSEWVSRLPAVIKAINNTPTRLTGEKPVDTIKGKSVTAKASLPSNYP